jgi:hypothetical protein
VYGLVASKAKYDEPKEKPFGPLEEEPRFHFGSDPYWLQKFIYVIQNHVCRSHS